MSKEDRYAHLGGDDAENDVEADDAPDGIRVTLSDGDETADVHLDDADLSVGDLETLFEDIDAESVAAGDVEVVPAESTATSDASPLARGVQASGLLPRAVLRSGTAGVSASVTLLRKYLGE